MAVQAVQEAGTGAPEGPGPAAGLEAGAAFARAAFAGAAFAGALRETGLQSPGPAGGAQTPRGGQGPQEGGEWATRQSP